MNERVAAALQASPIDTAGQAPVVLAFQQVTHRFGTRVALDAVSFDCRAGEFVALLGASGAGKTTLLRGAAGLCAFDSGVVSIAGRDARGLAARERRTVAMVFQSHALIDRLSALDNVLAGRLGYSPRWRSWSRRFTRADTLLALECLDRVGLLARSQQRTDTLSGGEQQRVALARALAQAPAVLLADEPVASLDPMTGAAILQLLQECCRERQVSVLCSLHQTALALVHADRVVGLRAGRVVCDRPPAQVDAIRIAEIYGTAA
ncbi:MAG: phosphonate ABC transporter ATP-binding protein [Proteobacteria bacterium]|nr:phosphonate ABC transporter ATP-binding protein [Burkholderiales bacterium]